MKPYISFPNNLPKNYRSPTLIESVSCSKMIRMDGGCPAQEKNCVNDFFLEAGNNKRSFILPENFEKR